MDDFSLSDPQAQREPSWRAWTPCAEYVPSPGTRCRLRVRGRGMIFGTGNGVNEIAATWDGAGWLVEGGRLAEGYAPVAWQRA